jgi:hypothetical protein
LPLIPSAFTVALLAALESMLSAVVADGMTGDRHNSNVELVAQGIANIVSPLFGGIPATGAIARTATNIRAGARSPMAGIVHALTLLGILLVAAPLASYIPLTVWQPCCSWWPTTWASGKRLAEFFNSTSPQSRFGLSPLGSRCLPTLRWPWPWE